MSTPDAEANLQTEIAALRQKRPASTSPLQDTLKKPCFQDSPERAQNPSANLILEEEEEVNNMEKLMVSASQ